jgi:hypothetical protein
MHKITTFRLQGDIIMQMQQQFENNNDICLPVSTQNQLCTCGKMISTKNMKNHLKTRQHEKRVNEVVDVLISLMVGIEFKEQKETKGQKKNDNECVEKSYSQKTKKYTYNWRSNNPDKYRELARAHANTYYQNNKEKIKEKKMKKYHELKEAAASATTSVESLGHETE